MLSRVADSLYWMSRYLERAEHTARLIDVGLNLMLDQTPAVAERRWGRLLTSLHAPALPEEDANNTYQITQAMTFETANETSIVACIEVARENLRQVREQISSEMWEQLNRLFLFVKSTNIKEVWNTGPNEFLRMVKDGSHLFQGITDSTMNHGEGWQFIQLGRFIERAMATATLLDLYFKDFTDGQWQQTKVSGYLDWVGLLKLCTAFEAYCKVYTADLRPERIAEFLLLNAECPRSVRFAAETIHAAFQSLSETTGARKTGRAGRLSGRLRASLSFGQIDEIMEAGLHLYLNDIQRQCAQIHTAIQQTYISYPIETALAS
jgi:uncharacterized alpha-E superfamily protein